MNQNLTLPSRIGWFAPWTWKRRRTILIALSVGISVYVLSPVLVHYTALRLWSATGFHLPAYDVIYDTVYAPINFCRRHLPIIDEFYDAQWHWLQRQFGSPVGF